MANDKSHGKEGDEYIQPQKNPMADGLSQKKNSVATNSTISSTSSANSQDSKKLHLKNEIISFDDNDGNNILRAT